MGNKTKNKEFITLDFNEKSDTPYKFEDHFEEHIEKFVTIDELHKYTLDYLPFNTEDVEKQIAEMKIMAPRCYRMSLKIYL